MPNYQAISRKNHSHLHWNRSSGYSFATEDTLIGLSIAELPKAVMAMPIAFVDQSGSFAPVAVLGLQTKQNLFVARNGRWLGSYIPAALRTHPFRLAINGDQHMLCVDTDSDLISSETGEGFFEPDGQPTQAIQETLNMLTLLERSRSATAAACAALKKHQLLGPWTISVKSDNGEKKIAGLFQINEEALNSLPADALHDVRQAGALVMAYCQLLSRQHLPMLGELAKAHSSAAAQAVKPTTPLDGGSGPDFFKKNETISFAGLR